jgi:hypothetical protein
MAVESAVLTDSAGLAVAPAGLNPETCQEFIR